MLSLSYDDTKGVMKESERKNFNGTMQLGYRKDKWNVRQSLAVGLTGIKILLMESLVLTYR